MARPPASAVKSPGLQAVIEGQGPTIVAPQAAPPVARPQAVAPPPPPRPVPIRAARPLVRGNLAETIDSDDSASLVLQTESPSSVLPAARPMAAPPEAEMSIWERYWWLWLVVLPAIPLTALTIVLAVWILRMLL
jgi:hypothetical protein